MYKWGLNAPSGAGCLPTAATASFHESPSHESQCTFWCRVLTDRMRTCRP